MSGAIFAEVGHAGFRVGVGECQSLVVTAVDCWLQSSKEILVQMESRKRRHEDTPYFAHNKARIIEARQEVQSGNNTVFILTAFNVICRYFWVCNHR